MSPSLVQYVPLLPLLGFVFSGLIGRRLGKLAVSMVSCGTLVASFAISLGLFFGYGHEGPVTVVLWQWMAAGSLSIPVAFLIDPLSLVMLMVVTGVGSLIHIYSIGYMSHDAGYHRYFAYLNLFVFFMLILVLADSLPLAFVGWEGVGLCSYLLIGFWYEKPSAADAGLKAFLVNRVGDFGFVVAMLASFVLFGTLSMSGIAAAAPAALAAHGAGALTLVAGMLFFAATGKSAQIPLYVWLPDAMEGPSPVSALIHAATMVTSGVYVLVRMFAVYALVPDVLWWVALVGAATTVFAATMGLVATDIKKVLAYSTISQLGYMFLGVGVGAVTAGLFHLVTHAFFKACLFLGAGAVMHALHDETDMRKMGGLRRKLPVTHATMLFATLAIVGFPGLAGFVSKDAILVAAYESHAWLPLALGVVTVGLTSFYMFRMYFLTFHGEPRGDGHVFAHAHDATPSMAFALIPLAILSIVAGALGWPAAFGGGQRFAHFVTPALHLPAAEAHAHLSLSQELLLSGGFALPGILGFALAWSWYRKPSPGPARLAASFAPIYRLFTRKWYIDDLYDVAVVGSVLRGSRFLRTWVDELLIDGTINLIGVLAQILGEVLRTFQTGSIRVYALFLALGVTAVLLLVVL